MLQYITRGKTNPRRKQKLLFSCYPGDRAKHFDRLAALILNEQDCAIWYDDKDEAVSEEDLMGMNLLVIPVTRDYLTRDSSAYISDYHLAVKHQIPILPILMEEGLEELFSERCNGIQALSIVSHDDTEIPFETKLSDYLSHILVGDALRQEIRSAFDGYIFLSYRKIDRRHAQALMQLIHENNDCEAMAIWYDEFLTAGEKFDEEIQAAIEKSQLFAMVITPNLIGSTYIPEHEYGKAVAKGMPRLLTVMEDTDLTELETKYPALGEVADGRDKKAFAAQLTSRLADVKRPAPSTRKTYLLGRAYLNGIDVELDPVKAFCLISGAARRGEVDAMSTLIHMYRYGKGVARNYEKAAAWNVELVKAYEKRMKEDNSYDNQLAYIQACHSCGKAWLELGRTEMAKLFFEKLTEADPNQFADWVAAGYTYLGDAEKGNETARRQYHEKALGIMETVADDKEDDMETKRQLAVSYAKLGDSHFQNGRGAEAIDYYKKQLAIMEELHQKTDDHIITREYAAALTRLADAYDATGDTAQAIADYGKSAKILSDLSDETRELQDIRELVRVNKNLGLIFIKSGSYDAAEDILNPAAQWMQAILTQTGLPEDYIEAILTQAYLGDAYLGKTPSDPKRAWNAYLTANEIGEEFRKRHKIPDANRYAAITYERMGQYFAKVQEPEGAIKAFENCVILREMVMEALEVPDANVIQELASAYFNLGVMIGQYRGDAEQALKYLTASDHLAPSNKTKELIRILLG